MPSIFATDVIPELPLKAVTPKPKTRTYGVAGVFRHPFPEGEPGPEMILIPPGCFITTSNSPPPLPDAILAEQNQPLPLACLDEFALGRNEVTFEEYDRFVQATQRRLPDDVGFGRGRNPVIDVNWQDATDYTAWLTTQTGTNYRLPTETEWEYAARAGTNQAWPWGDELGVNQAVCRGCGSPWDFISVAPVGAHPAHPWGVNDLGGNVWEWTCSPFVAQPLVMNLVRNVQPQRYEEGNQCSEPTPTGSWVMRGGSWFNIPEQLRNSYRTGQPAHYRYKTLGFRVAWHDHQLPMTHLLLRVMPADAKIWLLNPERLAHTDMQLPMGRYRLRIERQGFISFDQWIELTQPEQELRMEMKPINRAMARTADVREAKPPAPINELATYPLTIVTNPATAQIVLLDPERPYTPGMELPNGRYRLRVQAPSYETLEHTVEINQEGVNVTLELAWIEPITGITFVRIPAGSFEMGSPAHEQHHNADESPQHSVNISSFLMGKYDVTFAQWDACVAARGCNYRPSDQGWGRDQRPVINISWLDADEFANWLSRKTKRKYRLPTEAEWEYAARAGTTTAYWWGNNMDRGRANCHGCGSQWDNIQTSPVGSFAPNPWGLFDTTGNVWQWTCSIYVNVYDGTENNCVGKDNKKLRGLRGGSWYNLPHWMRSATRYRDVPSSRNNYTGFRLVGIL